MKSTTQRRTFMVGNRHTYRAARTAPAIKTPGSIHRLGYLCEACEYLITRGRLCSECASDAR